MEKAPRPTGSNAHTDATATTNANETLIRGTNNCTNYYESTTDYESVRKTLSLVLRNT